MIGLVYWAIVVHFLRVASPVYFDLAGPMPSFFCYGIAPDMGEYARHRLYYDVLYFLPYCLTGLIMTAVGFGVTPLVIRCIKPSWLGRFTGATISTLALLLLLATGADVCSHLGLWNSPIFLLRGNWYLGDILILGEVFIPASVLSGAIEVAKHWFRTPTR
jgi:hypothetical protein